MAESKLSFAKGASIHRPPMFSGINYQFWKIRIKILGQMYRVLDLYLGFDLDFEPSSYLG